MDKIRITSDADDNFRLDPDPGSLLMNDTKLTPADVTVVGSAYTNSSFAAFANRPTATMLFAYDTSGKKDRLWLQNPANAGTLMNPLSTGLDLGSDVGFDIAGAANRGYVAGAQSGRSGARLYTARRDDRQDAPAGPDRRRQRRRDRARGLAGPVGGRTGGDGSRAGPSPPNRTGNVCEPLGDLTRATPHRSSDPQPHSTKLRSSPAWLTGDREEALAALYDLYGGASTRSACTSCTTAGSRRTSCRRRSCGCGAQRIGTTPAARRFGRSSTRWHDEPPSTCGGGARESRRPWPTGSETEDSVGGAAFDEVVLRLDVGEALDTLTPAHREVLELQYHGDLTQTQVAERLGIPLGTVKTRTLYALRSLSTELKERGLVD